MHHLALPLRVSTTGALVSLADGSPAEVGQSVAVLLATRVGERRSEPGYGAADPLGYRPARAAVVDTAAVARWEPRATPDLVDLAAVVPTVTGGRP